MNFLEIDNTKGSEIYLNFLDDLICLLQEYREKIREEVYYDELQ